MKINFILISIISLALLVSCGGSKESAKKDTEQMQMETTPSGLKYAVLMEGNGKKPTFGNKITIAYTGKLEDGKVFESTYKNNRPMTVVLGEGDLIEGLQEALLTMKEGGKRYLEIPPDLAYGSRGVRDVIPPNSTLIFELELLKVEK